MFTDEMMLYRMFLRYCNSHAATKVSCLSKSSSIKLESTLENYIRVKVAKFKNVEEFILVVEQKGIMKLAFKIESPVKFQDKNHDTNFLLETVDGELEIVFRNS